MASHKSVAQYYENSLVATKFLNIWNLLRLHPFFHVEGSSIDP